LLLVVDSSTLFDTVAEQMVCDALLANS